MNKSTIVIAFLCVGLVGSNGWWAYKMIDAGISYSYQSNVLLEHQEALAQSFAIIKAMSQGMTTKVQVVAAAASPGAEPFEKEGYTWVGRLGLKFGVDGKLQEAIPSWSEQ